MKYTATDIEVKHAEAVDWVNWFLTQQVQRGAGKEQKEFMEGLLYAFLDSGNAFANGGALGQVKCPKCQGNGNTGLMLAGATKPMQCSNCEGTGFIQPGVNADGADNA